jgi:DNA-binding response OmpR family regulator
MVTARAALAEKVDGLDAGADDYLTKPFSIEELRARVRALLRRRDKPAVAQITIEDLALDPARRTVARGSRVIELSAREFALLDYLMRNAHRPVTRTSIAEHVWGFHFDYGSNVIDVYIGYLRSKIERGKEKKLIHTIRNIGYQLG